MLENIKKLQVKSVFLLFLSGFGFYLCIFSRNHLVPMVDGPYYLIQIKSILTTGSLVYGAPPLTFYLLSIFSFLSGDVTSGLKVGVSFFCALSTIPAYFLTALLFLAIYTVLVLIFDVDRRSFMKSVGIITSIILAFIFVATTFFSSLFEDSNLVFYFIRDLVDMKDRIPANSIMFTEHGVHYWVEYVDEVEVARASIEKLSPELGESYSHVLFILSKDRIPPIPYKTLFIGRKFLLAELPFIHRNK